MGAIACIDNAPAEFRSFPLCVAISAEPPCRMAVFPWMPATLTLTREPMTAEPFLPERRTLKSLREAARACRGCPLWKTGTQTVFGEGPVHAPVLMVGEQPGDREDIEGRPFVGPAGRLLDQALV